MHLISSLSEIAAGVNSPHPDVVLAALGHLRDAPAALQRLHHHEEDQNWRVLNGFQVTELSDLVSLLLQAEYRMGRVARAIARMVAASDAVEEAGVKLQRCRPPVGMVGSLAVCLVATKAVGRLDAVHVEINNLLEGPLAKANDCAWRTWEEDKLLPEMERSLTTLMQCNRSLVRRIQGLQRVGHQIQLFHERARSEKDPRGRDLHALSAVDHEFQLIASMVSTSVRQLVARINAGEDKPIRLINNVQRTLTDQLDSAMDLNHTRFSGTLTLRSLRDIDEAFHVSRPHQADVGLPARRFEVVLLGLSRLLDADVAYQRVNQGIKDRGWLVQARDALTTAQILDHCLVSLDTALVRLLRNDVMNDDGVILAPQHFNALAHHRDGIESATINGLLDFPEVSPLVSRLKEVIRISLSPWLWSTLRTSICSLRFVLGETRRAPVGFIE